MLAPPRGQRTRPSIATPRAASRAVVGRDHAAREAHRLGAGTVPKQQQDLAARDLERRKACVAVELGEPEQRPVELRRPSEIRHVQRGFEHARHRRRPAHSNSPRSTVTAWPPSTTRSPADRTRTTPPRAEAWNPVMAVVRSRAAQNGASVQWAEPVTGSSGTPTAGAKKRDTKS